MSKSGNKKQRLPWVKFVILLVCVLVGRSVLRIPRTTWSAKGSPREAAMAEEVIRRAAGPRDIQRVILISLDTLRADHLGCYGYSRETSPNLDALAAESIVFNHALSPMPATLPAHSSMMTGTNPYYHQVHDNVNSPLAASNTTLAEILKENGFVTGAIIGAYVLDRQFGLDQGFDTYDDAIDTSQQVSELCPFSNERPADEVTRRAGQWLEEHQVARSFLFLHYYDPHFPYVWHEGTPFKFPSLMPSFKDCYDSEIAYTDHWVGQFIDRLKQMGLYDSSLIIVVGDHGESLGDHKEGAHGFFVYHSSIHVPLIIKLPGLATPVRINNVVGLIDIVPTVCQLLGIEPPTEVEGKSLLGDIRQDRDRAVYCESLTPTAYNGQSLLGLVTERYKYIHTTRAELYDLCDDPGETEDIIDEYPEIARMFEDRLLTKLSGTDMRPSDSKIELTQEARVRLAALGYVGGVVDDDYDFAGTKEDPKDMIDFHERWQSINPLIAAKNYAEARDQVLAGITERPEFYHPIMSTVAYALATDPATLDPEAAIAIAKHGAEVTKYCDESNLNVLTVAYEAAGRYEEVRKIEALLAKLVAQKEGETQDSAMPAPNTPIDNPLNIDK